MLTSRWLGSQHWWSKIIKSGLCSLFNFIYLDKCEIWLFGFHFQTSPWFGSHAFMPPGHSGCVQVGAGECSNEHEAKHLAPSEPDPVPCRVDWVHALLSWNRKIYHALGEKWWCSHHTISGQISYQAKLLSRTLKKRITCMQSILSFTFLYTHTSSMVWRKPNEGLFW